ncbi:hypothetical protein FIBSPDRAFT_495304 [Athelia psychrophila]|uniref:Uncharacterized protein n=1 Tax=Athelia psychrophila TaxID=1759441 RepID=A0A166KIT6_9AGAM|nr:hypothetical protein FIBSPDRAFT_495304 [Fibularhizoctonia sp. CBS 109695]
MNQRSASHLRRHRPFLCQNVTKSRTTNCEAYKCQTRSPEPSYIIAVSCCGVCDCVGNQPNDFRSRELRKGGSVLEALPANPRGLGSVPGSVYRNRICMAGYVGLCFGFTLLF